MKYIVIRSRDLELMFTFPYCIVHSHMFATMKLAFAESTCVAAGFITNGICHGRSDSLDIDARGVDTELLVRGGAA